MAWRKLAGILPSLCQLLAFFFFFNCNETSGNELDDQHRYIFEFFIVFMDLGHAVKYYIGSRLLEPLE